jgi:hypothetical protein
MPHSVFISHQQQQLSLEIDDSVDLWTNESEGARALGDADFAEAVYQSLQHPTDYPAVAEGIVPGDVVAIVVDADLPNPVWAIVGALRVLKPLQLDRIDVVIAEAATEATRSAIRESLPPGIEMTVHCGKSRDDLRYLAANEAADAIYLNRRVVDADLVIPITVMRQTDPLLVSTTTSPVFPSLADYPSQARARLNVEDVAVVSPRRRSTSNDEAAQVSWLLGLQWTVAVDVNAMGEPTSVQAGTPQGVTTRSVSNDENASVPFAAEIVVVCVDGREQQQSLANVLRAAFVARGHATPDGSIVIVSDIKELGTLIDIEDEDFDTGTYEANDDEEGGSEQTPFPSIVSTADHARRLLHTLINDTESSHRYLLYSACDEAEVESFGFGAIKDQHALTRLINGHESCIVLRNAQLAPVFMGHQRSS